MKRVAPAFQPREDEGDLDRRVVRLLTALFLFALALLVTFTIAVFVMGCARSLDTAVLTANAGREVLAESKEAVTDACAPAYAAAKTSADLDAVDKRCLPAIKTYQLLRAAWIVTVAAIGAARVADEETPELAGVVSDLGRALVAMQEALRALPAPAPSRGQP